MKAFFVTVLMLISAAPAFAANDCIWTRNVRDWKVTGRDSLEIRENGRRGRIYSVRTYSCPQLDRADALGFQTYGGSSQFCAGDSLHLYTFGGREIDVCPTRKITRVR